MNREREGESKQIVMKHERLSTTEWKSQLMLLLKQLLNIYVKVSFAEKNPNIVHLNFMQNIRAFVIAENVMTPKVMVSVK